MSTETIIKPWTGDITKTGGIKHLATEFGGIIGTESLIGAGSGGIIKETI